MPCDGKIGPSSVPSARARMSIRGGTTTIAPGVSATGATAASVPLMTSPTPCCTRASAHCHTGFSPPSCCACRVHRAVLRESWGCMAGPSYRWCWWLRNTAVSYETDRQVEGTVEADDLYHTAGQKGQARQGGKKALGRRARGRRKKREPGRGHYDKDRPAIIAW